MNLTLIRPNEAPLSTVIDPQAAPITALKGRAAFLSNMACAHGGDAPMSLRMRGLVYPSVEHAYMAAKSTDDVVRSRIAALPSPYDAKRLGASPARGGIVVLRPDWEEVKLPLMLGLLRQKFKVPAYRERLLQTGQAMIMEGNTWGDTFWGVCNAKGRNHLGRFLMVVREELRG